MKYYLILFVFFLFVITSCTNRDKTDPSYRATLNGLRYNVKATIVKMSQEDSRSADKFHDPTINHIALIRDIYDSTLFTEYNFYSQENYYNHRVGDTLKWDYIREDRWFHIKPRN